MFHSLFVRGCVCLLFRKPKPSYTTLFLQLLHVTKAAQNSGGTHTHTPGLEGDARERVCPVYSSFPPSFCLEQAVLLSDAVSVSLSLSERVLRENSTPSSLDFVFPLLRQ
jgi:hypothetical protein